MATFLFDTTIFGPVFSRRLGKSLGINLLPNNRKICNFNCIYCECGITHDSTGVVSSLPTRQNIKVMLEERMKEIIQKKERLDSITFAGNGEPTLHPEFSVIVDDTVELKLKYMPDVNIAVLSNATTIHDKLIVGALNKVDFNILKLDSAIEETQRLINCPNSNFSLEETIKNLKKFKGGLIIQTLFFTGKIKGQYIDNTTKKEVNA